MPRERALWVLPVGALILACGGALSAAPSPAASGSAAASAGPATAASSPLGLSWQGEPVQIKASKLRVDLAARQATLEGHVTLQRGTATLRCPQITLRFDAQGQVTWAQGTGGVTVDDRDLHAEASETGFDLEKRTLTLRGGVRVHKAGVRLTAAAASIDLPRQQVELTEVEGAVMAPGSAASAASGAAH